MDWVIKMTKALLVATWPAIALALLGVLPLPLQQWLVWLGVLLLVLHFVEYLIVRSRLTQRLDGGSGFIGTMVFGFAYWLPLLKEKQSDS